MAKCKICGARFDKSEAEDEFCIEHPLFDYNNFTIPLCASCAIEIFDNEEDGYYYETCECCGKRFDPFIEESNFAMNNDGTNLMSWWSEFGYVCCDCAENKIAEYFREHEAELEIDDMWDSSDDDVPEGCRACGGDYPLCKEGCPLFDD